VYTGTRTAQGRTITSFGETEEAVSKVLHTGNPEEKHGEIAQTLKS
jgi:cystathionine beta-lyase/cystathionine gamma-synthase